jgi:hypothetical protein
MARSGDHWGRERLNLDPREGCDVAWQTRLTGEMVWLC